MNHSCTVPLLTEVSDSRIAIDNQFLALAFDSESDFILSRDQDLLTLSSWYGIAIVSPSTLLHMP